MDKITVTILAYKSKYLRRTLEAISAQTYKNIEIIVRDDCSPENVKEVTLEYSKIDNRVKYICNEKNMGELVAWMEAMKACNTKYILVTHDDDIMEPELVEKEAAVFDAHNDVIMVSCVNRLIDSRSYVLRENHLPSDEGFISMFEDSSFLHERDDGKYDYYFRRNKNLTFLATAMSNKTFNSSIMYRSDIIKKAILDGKFDDFNRETALDITKDLLLNELGSLYIINDLLYNYRLHDGQTSADKSRKLHIVYEHLVSYCKPRLSENLFFNLKGFLYENIMNQKIMHELKDCRIIELKKDILEAISYIDIDNTLLDNFLIRVKYLQAVTEQGQIRRSYVIWGAGSAGIITKKLLDVLLPNFYFMGFIDSNKKGPLGPYVVVSPNDYDFNSENLIVISVSGYFKNIMGQLDSKGLEMLEDYIFGYGCYSAKSGMGLRRNAAFEFDKK